MAVAAVLVTAVFHPRLVLSLGQCDPNGHCQGTRGTQKCRPWLCHVYPVGGSWRQKGLLLIRVANFNGFLQGN